MECKYCGDSGVDPGTLLPCWDCRINSVAYGAGNNSKGMVVEATMRGIRLDAILFANPGAEFPRIYDDLAATSEWLVAHGQPPITTVRRVNASGDVLALEQDCINRKALPSLAYGWKTCSQKFKAQPQEKWHNHWDKAKQEWARGRQVVRLVGFHAAEQHRAKVYETPKYTNRYPLIEWGMDQDASIAAIKRAGLAVPGKSACFFCPATRVPELIQLKAEHPDLLARALAMEANAEIHGVKGLGRRFNWAEKLQALEAEPDAEDEPQLGMDFPCECSDGSLD